MKLKENIKTVILILLILLSIILSIKVWAYDSGMVSSDIYLYRWIEELKIGLKYGFNTGSYDIAAEEQNFENSIFLPSQIVINQNGAHGGFLLNTKELNTASQGVKDIIKSSFDDEQMSWADSNYYEFKDALNKTSIYIDYGMVFSYDIFSEYIGVLPNKFGQDISFDKIVILFDSKINVYFKNSNTSAVKKLQSGPSDKSSEIYERLRGAHQALKPCIFGFESKGYSNIGVDDFVILWSDEIITNEIEQVSALEEEEANGSSKLLEAVLKAFKYNISFSKSYPDEKGNRVYVNGISTLKFFNDGFVEYVASNPQRGVDLSQDALQNISKIKLLNLTTRFLSKIGSQTLGGAAATVKYAGMEQNTADRTIRVFYDYIIDAIPFKCEDGIKGYPITIDINENGQISYSKIYANTFKYTNNKISNLDYESLFEIISINGHKSVGSLALYYEKSVLQNKVITKWNYSSQ